MSCVLCYRQSPVFNVFISNLPQLLDQNHLMGWTVMPTCLMLLQYCPCPPHDNSHLQPHPTYSLWFLEPHARRCWLMSLLVLLYKVGVSYEFIYKSKFFLTYRFKVNTKSFKYVICVIAYMSVYKIKTDFINRSRYYKLSKNNKNLTIPLL